MLASPPAELFQRKKQDVVLCRHPENTERLWGRFLGTSLGLLGKVFFWLCSHGPAGESDPVIPRAAKPRSRKEETPTKRQLNSYRNGKERGGDTGELSAVSQAASKSPPALNPQASPARAGGSCGGRAARGGAGRRGCEEPAGTARPCWLGSPQSAAPQALEKGIWEKEEAAGSGKRSPRAPCPAPLLLGPRE